MYLGVAYLKQSDTQRAERALRDAKHLASVLRDQRVLSDIEPHLSSLAANRPEAPAPR
jgi:hypothetical protein